MSVQEQVLRLNQHVALSYAAIDVMGGEIPQHPNIANLAQAITTIPNENQGGAIGNIGDLAVGEIVHIYMNGLFRPWMIWRHGAPDNTYHGYPSDAVFLLSALAVDHRRFSASATASGYVESEVYAWLNNQFIQLFPEWLREIIIEGRIPFRVDISGNTVQSGEQGALSKAFIPSVNEVGIAGGSIPLGTNFGAFASNASRIANDVSGQPSIWWTRTPSAATGNMLTVIAVSGASTARGVVDTAVRVRQAIALPSAIKIQRTETFNTIKKEN